jgi:hypothetical protein
MHYSYFFVPHPYRRQRDYSNLISISYLRRASNYEPITLFYSPLCQLTGAFLGNQVIDSVVAAEAAQRDVALERALAEVESLQSRLEEAERHAEQFRLIGSSTESMLRELRDRSAASKEAQELELSK